MARMIIYKITNKINGKVYIGQTLRTLAERFKQHCKSAGCRALSKAIIKYGAESFTIEQIDSADYLDELNKKESEWIKKANALSPFGYNLNTGGGNKWWSKESKEKMSQSHKGKTFTEEHKAKISRSVKNKIKENPELFLNGSKAMLKWLEKEILNKRHPKKDKKLSQESKKRISAAKMGEGNPMFGKSCNKEQLRALQDGRDKLKLNAKKIKCHQNGVVYNSTKDAAQLLGLARSSITNVLVGFRRTCKGYTFEYVKEFSNES